jgi:beta-1,4-mannosyl-glycoprotein beta-1,4-N-acetylglucosaminyltransferase
MKIIDSFIFFNELDLLKYRLEITNEYIDYFILVESRHSFAGNEKPLYYEENKKMFEKFHDKIIHIVVDDMPYKKGINFSHDQLAWKNEEHQRNSIKKGIEKLNLKNDDIIITSDLDEIINPDILLKVKTNTLQYDQEGLNRLALDMYYYNLNSLVARQEWHGIKLLNYKTYNNLNFSFETMRTYEWHNHVNIIPYGGWHLSYFGNTDFITNKIQNFSHQEYNNNSFLDSKRINDSIDNHLNLIDNNRKLEYVPIKNNNFLPPKYDIYLKNFYEE